MTKTKTELTELFASKLTNTVFLESTFDDVITILNGSTTNQKSHFMDLIFQGKDEKVGRSVREALYANAQTNANTEATNAMVDDALSLTELQRIFA